MKRTHKTLFTLLPLGFAACANPEVSKDMQRPPTDLTLLSELPIALGSVAWERDFERALTRVESAERPLLLVFQEVPG